MKRNEEKGEIIKKEKTIYVYIFFSQANVLTLPKELFTRLFCKFYRLFSVNCKELEG